MRILITGGCGFVGTNLALFLKSKGFTINSLDNLSRKGSRYNLNLLKEKKIKNFNFDIFNFKKIQKLPKYDLIIDCCAEAAVEISKKDIERKSEKIIQKLYFYQVAGFIPLRRLIILLTKELLNQN